MPLKSILRLAVLSFLLLGGAAQAADIRVMISAGFFQVYSQLGPQFEKATGHHLITTRGPSLGDSPEAIPTRLGRGEGGVEQARWRTQRAQRYDRES